MSVALCGISLTCRDVNEAQTITSALLEQKLVACVKQLPVHSQFLWKGDVEHNDEILLQMIGRRKDITTIEDVVKGLHSYDTFVLEVTNLEYLNAPALAWLNKELTQY